uniref:ComEC/Rec2 family competence protein n=1 Tax=Paracoccus sp. TRP TaxID=412597 RepID=UPI001ED9374B|nr:ComEC/Rec2 family competence protein [Paracoccus sp. TRP]
MTESVNTSLIGLPVVRRERLASQSAVPRPPVTLRAGLLPWIPFWLALGIGGWFLLRDEPGRKFYAALVLIGGMSLLLSLAAPRLAETGRIGWPWADRLRLVGLALCLITLGAGLAGGRAHMVAAPVLGFRYYGPVEGRVIGIDRSSSDRIRLLLDRVRLHKVPPTRTPERVRVSLHDYETLPVPGQQVMLTAHLAPPAGPTEPGAFDFRRLAWFERLGAVGYARTPVLTVAPPAEDGLLSMHRLRMNLAESMRQKIGGQAGAVAAALMTGDRSGIAEQTNQIMRDSNLYHIISISGLHMSMLAGFVYAGLRLVGTAIQGATGLRPGPLHKLAAAGALTAAGVYLWLSGGGVATERSFIMVAVMLLAIIADRRAVSLRTVAVAATIVLVVKPEALTDPGFQMSFAATVALILVHEPWLKVSPHLTWWTRPILMLVVSSLVASLATAPIAAAHFGRMTQYGLLANMLVVPVVGVLVMPGGVMAALLAPIGLAQPALWLMGVGTSWMLMIAQWIADLRGAVMLIPAAPNSVLPVMAIGAVLVTLGPMGGYHRAALFSRRLAGAVLMVSAIILWLTDRRPDILISAQGDAVAIMTPAGRVPSKPTGGSFAVRNWLEADGDPADQVQAAAHQLWRGEASNRVAKLTQSANPLLIRHLTKSSAEQNSGTFCQNQEIVVITGRLSDGKTSKEGCLIVDTDYLRIHGATAIYLHQNRLEIISTETSPKERFWSSSSS